MNQNQIGIVVRGRLTRPRCSSDQNMHGDSGFPREGRQDVRAKGFASYDRAAMAWIIPPWISAMISNDRLRLA